MADEVLLPPPPDETPKLPEELPVLPLRAGVAHREVGGGSDLDVDAAGSQRESGWDSEPSTCRQDSTGGTRCHCDIMCHA